MRRAFEAHAATAGFKVAIFPKLYFTNDNWPFHSEFKKGVPLRGWFTCSPKSYCRKVNSCCPWKWVFRWAQKEKVYVFLSPNCHLSHNHDLNPPLIKFDGRTEVKLADDLTPTEAEFIKQQTLSRTPIPKLQVNMEREFPTRSFEYDMLYRLTQKTLNLEYGNDRTQIHELFQKGDQLRLHGGVFIVEPSSNNDFGFEAIHGQTKLMREYAITYGVNDLKMADGTHHFSKHGTQAVFWNVVDCLLLSKFCGFTFCFSENSTPIISGAEQFFPGEGKEDPTKTGANETLQFGELLGYYDPFVDCEVPVSDENTDTLPLSLNPITVSVDSPPSKHAAGSMHSQSSRSGNTASAPTAGVKTSNAVFMTDEGSAFPLVANHFGWCHILDRKHFVDQILTTWHNLADPDQYRQDIYDILDSPSEEEYERRMREAKLAHMTEKAQAFLSKISEFRHKLVYAYTSKYCTCAHISTQRSEGGMSALKGNGVLKNYLRNATYVEALNRVMQVARNQDRTARDELMKCRRTGNHLGSVVRKYLVNVKLLSLKLSHVEKSEWDHTYIVKESVNSEHQCLVNLQAPILWKGRNYTTITGTCTFYKSSLLICPCACAAAQRQGLDLDDAKYIHPRYWIAHHPLYPIALASIPMADFSDAPWSSHYQVQPAGVSSTPLTFSTQDSGDAAILQARTEIFDRLGDMTNWKQARRVTHLRDIINPLVKVASSSSRNCKYACAYIIELENRLRRSCLEQPTVFLRATSAVDGALNRYGKHMLPKNTERKELRRRKRRKGHQTPKDNDGQPNGIGNGDGDGEGKKRGCTLCRDVMKLPMRIYTTHRRGGSKCPSAGKPLPLTNIPGCATNAKRKSPPKATRKSLPAESALVTGSTRKSLPAESAIVAGSTRKSSVDNIPMSERKSPPEAASLAAGPTGSALAAGPTGSSLAAGPTGRALEAGPTTTTASTARTTYEILTQLDEGKNEECTEQSYSSGEAGDKIPQDTSTRGVLNATSININPTGGPMSSRRRAEQSRIAYALAELYPQKYGPLRQNHSQPVTPMTPYQLGQYQSQLDNYARDHFEGMSFADFTSFRNSWNISGSGLAVREDDPHEKEKGPLYREWLKRQRALIRSKTDCTPSSSESVQSESEDDSDSE